jgi:hypothetical protein
LAGTYGFTRRNARQLEAQAEKSLIAHFDGLRKPFGTDAKQPSLKARGGGERLFFASLLRPGRCRCLPDRKTAAAHWAPRIRSMPF